MEKIIELFEKNRLLVNIIVILTLAFGFYSYMNLQNEAFPSTNMDIMVMQVIYPGGSTYDIEQNAVVPIEEELKTIANIDEYSSFIVENTAIIVVRIDMDIKDTRPAKDEIFRRMKNVPNMSEDVKEINITEANTKTIAIYSLGVHFKKGTEGNEKELYYFSKNLENELKKVDGVGNIRITGRTDPEIKILTNPDKLKEYYISLSDIVNSIKFRNIRTTSGILKQENSITDKNKTLVTTGQFEDAYEVDNVILRSMFNGKVVRVQDVANVEEGFADKGTLVRINKNDGYSISIVKKENADILDTIKNINTFLKENKSIIPENIEVIPMSDNSRTIKDLLNATTQNLLGGFLIIFIVLIIFLDLKSALFTSLGMFIVMFVAFIFMWYTGATLNTITLAAIITVLGMIVDNSIVVSENIFNYQQKGFHGIEATKKAVYEVVAPMTISTLTTVVAFLPMIFVTGTMGRLINHYPKVVIVALITSLFQSIFILPNNMLTNKELRGQNLNNDKPKKLSGFLNYDRDVLFNKLRVPFTKILNKIIRLRYIAVIIFIGILISSVFIAKNIFNKFVLIYDTSADTILVDIDSGVGSSMENTKKYISQLEDIIYETVNKDDLVSVYSVAGKSGNVDSFSDGIYEELDNLGGIIVYLVPINERKKTAYDIVDEINIKIAQTSIKEEIPLLTVSAKMLLSPGKAVDIKVVGNNTDMAREVKEKIKAYLLSQKGIVNYIDNDKAGMEEIRVILDYEKIASLGLNVALVSKELRTAYAGTVATSIQGFENKLDFRVMIDKKYQYNTNILNDMLIPNAYNRLIYLKDIAQIVTTNSSSSIMHFNGSKAITINADINQGENTALVVMNSVKEYFSTISDNYPGITLEYAGEVKETSGSTIGLLKSYFVALIGIYIILLLQFKKFLEPLIILFIIPFGAVGVFIAFKLHSMPMSFVGGIGMIGLSGVVVNNGIIMVDLINKLIHENKNSTNEDILNSIVEGASSRLRAVFLTTTTTIVALIPTVYGIGGRADLIVPIVMAMAYGLLFASLLTLILLPCIFMIAYDLKLIRAS